MNIGILIGLHDVAWVLTPRLPLKKLDLSTSML